jgi:hypothetical protein
MDTQRNDSPDPAETDGEITINRMSLRHSGWVGYSADAVFLDRGDERIQIHSDKITKVGLRVLQWDIAVMSLLLVGVGGYVVATRNPLVGLAFGAVGVASLSRTYRKRYALIIQIENEPKPVTMHPEHPKKCHERLAEAVGLVQVR